jgi:hypothetical protein
MFSPTQPMAAPTALNPVGTALLTLTSTIFKGGQGSGPRLPMQMSEVMPANDPDLGAPQDAWC